VIQKAIYPVSFYRVKTRTIHAICEELLGRFNGESLRNWTSFLSCLVLAAKRPTSL
jgi:endonuclease III